MQLEIQYPDERDRIRFLSLASGSNGNCYYLGYKKHGILIDAGIGIRAIKKTLRNFDIPIETILGVFITHDHADHIKAVSQLGEKLHIPVYTTARIHEGINKSYYITHKLCHCVRYLEKQQPIQLAGFNIEAFEVPHDATDNVGYCIRMGGKVFSILTDIGEITPLAARYITEANYLVMEANYDEDMLRNGKYPVYLKQRITGGRGHLSNRATAEFLAGNITPALQYIWLCHLSGDNNSPELAYSTIESKLKEKSILIGQELHLCVLKRGTPSEMYEL